MLGIIFWIIIFVAIVNSSKGKNSEAQRQQQEIEQQRRTGTYQRSNNGSYNKTYNKTYNTANRQQEFNVNSTQQENRALERVLGEQPEKPYDPNHVHAYNHKVEPLKEASVVTRHRENEEQRERKELLEKKLEEQKKRNEKRERTSSNRSNRNNSHHFPKGRNGDSAMDVRPGEVVTICAYCRAKNILPRGAGGTYQCYFCREEIKA